MSSGKGKHRVKKVQIAIDKMIDLKDMGNSSQVNDMITRVLEKLRELESRVETEN